MTTQDEQGPQPEDDAREPQAAPPQKSAAARTRGCLLEIVETVLLTVIIFFVVQHFVAQPYKIYMVSMERTLQPEQMVLVDKLSPVFTDYRRGDVIVFNPPANVEGGPASDPYIKRVIGLAGDLVEIHDGAVWVNGVRLVEPYVYDGQPTVPLNGISSWLVPAGDLFVMGDHRAASSDSRYFGPIAKSAVIGRAWIRYWPMADFGWVPQAQYQGIPDPSPGQKVSPAPSN
ncbi:MAG TPA: signal peptidase I [Candidatus Limnocylindrales bacterium]